MSICTIIGAGVFGLAVALIANLPVKWFMSLTRLLSGLPRERPPKKIQVPPEFLGTFERLLAFALFFIDVSEAYTIMGAWIVVKLASNWQRRSPEKARVQTKAGETEQEIITHSLIALMTGTVSVAIGAVAGVLAREHPGLWSWLLAPWC